MSKAKILLVDDERSVHNVVTAYLKAEGYAFASAMDGNEGLRLARSFKPDVILLDVMLPGMDGIQVLSNLRRESSVYVIMLTARSEETDKIVGLSVGADDYLTKPFSPRELMARIQAGLRRVQNMNLDDPGSSPLIFSHIRIDPAERRVWVNDQLVDLTTIEFEVLYVLSQHHGNVLTREQLLEKAWGVDYFGDTRVVDVHVGHIRQKLGNDDFIETIRGIGYRFEDK